MKFELSQENLQAIINIHEFALKQLGTNLGNVIGLFDTLRNPIKDSEVTQTPVTEELKSEVNSEPEETESTKSE